MALAILPSGALPPTTYPRSTTQKWFLSDDADAYRASGGHPVYGPDDISYTYNSLGYRCPEFDADADLRVIAIGCSYVFGFGLAQDHVFAERVAARLRAHTGRSVVLWNLSIAGAANDYISRMLHLAVPLLDPDLVLINFTHMGRREYVSAQQQRVSYSPTLEPTDPVQKEIFRHFAALASPFDDQLNLFRNYKSVEALLADRAWLYSTIAAHDMRPLDEHLDPARSAGDLRSLDKARDGRHPGPQSHEALAEKYWRKLLERGELGRFCC
jgi:hypothetical protein